MQTISVLGIPLYNQSINNAVDLLIPTLLHSPALQNHIVTATGAHGMVEATRNDAFRKVLENSYLNLPDGMPGVWVGRLKGAKNMQRCYGPDFFEYMLTQTSPYPIKHFFCGGKEGVASELKEVAASRFGNQNISGIYCPPFRQLTDEEMKALGQQIIDSGAHVVWIGLSTPKQELFASRLSHFTRTCYIITVGAAFDFHTDRVKQAPKWMQKGGLEWLFRLLMEPKRLYKRYFYVVPKFIWLNMKEFIDFYIYRNKHV